MDEDQASLRMWFQSVDVDNSNSINADELRRALEAANLRFPKSIVAQMISPSLKGLNLEDKSHICFLLSRQVGERMYDADQNGAMSFEEFVSLHKFLNVVQGSFSNVARDQQYLSLNDVYMALQQAGYTLDQPSFYTACQSFDPNRLGKFKIDDFISLCIFLQSAKNLFNAFDTSRQGRISLDYNQFIYCAANLRI